MTNDVNESLINKQSVEKKVCAIIVEQLGLDADKEIVDLKLLQDLGADSLDQVECVMQIEDLFSIEIKDSDVESIITVRDLINLVYEVIPAEKKE